MRGGGLAHVAKLLVGTLAIHLVAVGIASFASFYSRGPAVLLASVAVAMVVANQIALLIMGFWFKVMLGSLFWAICLMAALGWLMLMTCRVLGAKRS